MLRKLWTWLVAQIVQPDPWEPPYPLPPGTILMREKVPSLDDNGLSLPGRLIAVVQSPEEVIDVVVAQRILDGFWMTTEIGGELETMDERDLWRLVARYQHRDPDLSPVEVERILRRQAA